MSISGGGVQGMGPGRLTGDFLNMSAIPFCARPAVALASFFLCLTCHRPFSNFAFFLRNTSIICLVSVCEWMRLQDKRMVSMPVRGDWMKGLGRSRGRGTNTTCFWRMRAVPELSFQRMRYSRRGNVSCDRQSIV